MKTVLTTIVMFTALLISIPANAFNMSSVKVCRAVSEIYTHILSDHSAGVPFNDAVKHSMNDVSAMIIKYGFDSNSSMLIKKAIFSLDNSVYNTTYWDDVVTKNDIEVQVEMLYGQCISKMAE